MAVFAYGNRFTGRVVHGRVEAAEGAQHALSVFRIGAVIDAWRRVPAYNTRHPVNVSRGTPICFL